MQKKFCTEEVLSAGINRDILRLVGGDIPEELFEEIRNSPEMKQFLDSIKTPVPEDVVKKSVLLERMRFRDRR